MITAEREEHDRVERKRIDEQMDAERDARKWPVSAFELAAKQNVLPTVQSFGRDQPEPPWAQSPSVDDDS